MHAQPTAQVILDEVRVPAANLLAETEGIGFGIAMNGLNGGRLNIAASSLGGAQAAFDKAAAYVSSRRAFGNSLLDEPTIRFTLADMATSLQTSRLMLWHAATALDDNAPPDKVEQCAMAKRFVTDSCYDVADQALQLHGGYGYLSEYGIEKIVRDLRVHRILEGDQRDHAGRPRPFDRVPLPGELTRTRCNAMVFAGKHSREQRQ